MSTIRLGESLNGRASFCFSCSPLRLLTYSSFLRLSAKMVEAPGIEPGSQNALDRASTRVATCLVSPAGRKVACSRQTSPVDLA